MKCQEFAQIVTELARSQMMDAAQRTRGLAHAEGCAPCAARLNSERALTAGLRALAASDEKWSASASTEAALLAAFRQKAAPPIIVPLSAVSRRWPRWAWAAAAAILFALGLIALSAVQDQASREVFVELPLPAPAITPPSKPPVAHSSARQEPRAEPPAPRAERWAQRASYRRLVTQDQQRPQQFLIRDGLTVYAGDSEVASDFFPLIYGAPPPLESGQLIRVQMPRSALVAYGLPVNLERADTPVKAELLVSEDGQARAIRFVR